jgi:hypothetical protein
VGYEPTHLSASRCAHGSSLADKFVCIHSIGEFAGKFNGERANLQGNRIWNINPRSPVVTWIPTAGVGFPLPKAASLGASFLLVADMDNPYGRFSAHSDVKKIPNAIPHSVERKLLTVSAFPPS